MKGSTVLTILGLAVVAAIHVILAQAISFITFDQIAIVAKVINYGITLIASIIILSTYVLYIWCEKVYRRMKKANPFRKEERK